MATAAIKQKFKEFNMKSRIVATVHDSVELVCPYTEIAQACEVVYDEMITYPYLKKVFGINFEVPLSVDVEVGRSFGDGVAVSFDEGTPTNLHEVSDYLSEN